MTRQPRFMLGKLAAVHLAAWLLSLSVFAATNSWAAVTTWPLASFLNIVTAIIAGLVTVTLVHEWFHYLGAKLVSGQYTIASRLSISLLQMVPWIGSCRSVI